MTTFRELCDNSVIKCIELTVQGVKEAMERPDFKINLSSFGGYDPVEGLCYGCIATCAIQKITNTKFDKNSIIGVYNRRHAIEYKIDTNEITFFEAIIDSSRQTSQFGLLNYFGNNRSVTRNFVEKHVEQIKLYSITCPVYWGPLTIIGYFEKCLIPALKEAGIN